MARTVEGPARAPARPAAREADPTGTAVAPFARVPVLVTAALTAVVLLVSGRSAGYYFDELYFVAAGSRHLQWGYLDQPPLVPALAGLAQAIAPGSPGVLRLPMVPAVAAAVVLAAATAREVGGGRGAQSLAALGVATSAVAMGGHWTATYTLDPCLWTALTWLVARWIRVRDDRLLWAAGAVTALSVVTKFLVPLLWAAVLLAVAVAGPRRLLRRPALWGGLALGAAAAVPTLVWQATHGWPTVAMGAVVRGEWEGTGVFLLVAALLPGPVIGTPLVLVAVARAFGTRFRRAPGRTRTARRVLVLAAVAFAVAVLAVHGRSYYLLGVLPALTAVGAAELTELCGARPPRLRAALRTAATTAAVAVVLAVLPVLPEPVARAAALPSTFLLDIERSNRDVGVAAGRTLDGLAPAERARTALVAEYYPLAAAADVYGGPRVTAYSPHRGYRLFGTPPESATAMLWLGYGPVPPEWSGAFPACRRLADAPAQQWFCTGRRVGWDTLWGRRPAS